MNVQKFVRTAVVFAMVAGISNAASAQADEIQVYQGGLAPVGVFNLTVHNNYTPKGIKTPGFPGAVVSNHSLNGVPEFAYGVTNWFEAGLYLPLYSLDDKMGFGVDGVKLRALFAAPNGDQRTFVYGANFEFSYNAKRWDTRRFTSEIRPIIGWHLNPIDLIFNPILDTSYEGGIGSLEFVPSTRLAYNVNKMWAVAVEEYADVGPLRKPLAAGNEAHAVYGVIDRAGKTWDIEFGAGVGMTDAADKFTLKLIVARDLYSRKK